MNFVETFLKNIGVVAVALLILCTTIALAVLAVASVLDFNDEFSGIATLIIGLSLVAWLAMIVTILQTIF